MVVENISFLNASTLNPSIIAPLIAVFFVMFLFFVVIGIACYIYSGFAFMAIARRAKLSTPGLAWIPGIGPLLIAFQTAKMHWWPWLLFLGYFIPYVNIVCILGLLVCSTIWYWKMFEKVGRPGWWAIISLIPIVNLVLFGIAAWGKKGK